MKLQLIGIIILLFLSLFYLAYFIILKIYKTNKNNKNNIIKFIKNIFFPIVSLITILFFIIYIGNITNNEYASGIVIEILLIFIALISFWGFYSDTKRVMNLGGILAIFGMISFIFSLKTPSIESENYKTVIIPLYDTNTIRDDLSAVIINITPDVNNQKNYHSIMQYSTNDTNNFYIPTMLDCKNFKLIDSQENKLEITRQEITLSNILYYHGFTCFQPKTTFDENTTKYTLCINPDNIIYE